MSRMRAVVSVFGRSRRDYGHFHGRLLLRRPLPPSTAKNSLDRSPRLILHFLPAHVPHAWVVSVFGRSRRDYGHFHGRLLLQRPLPPSTAKNSLDRSARLILHFGPPAMSQAHVSAGVPGYRSRPFMEDEPPPGRGVAIAKHLFSDAKGKGLERRPCQSSRRSRPEK